MANNCKTHVLSPLAPEFVPRNFHPPPVQPANTQDDENVQFVIEELSTFIEDVTLSPAKFDSSIRSLTVTFNRYVRSRDTLDAIVGAIFHKGIEEHNFRYNGARLCSHLSKNFHPTLNLADKSVKSPFESLLLDRCRQEYEKRNDLACGDDGGAYLRGFALFMSELFTQLEVAPNRRHDTLAVYILDLLKILLGISSKAISSKDNLKCVVQVLKLSGGHLDQLANDKMDELMNEIKSVLSKDNLDSTVRIMLTKVVDLKAENWGLSTTTSPVQANNSGGNVDGMNVPVFYGPDGMPLSNEEASFLETSYYQEYEYGIDGNPYANEEDGMDDEIEAAFEEFLRESGQ